MSSKKPAASDERFSRVQKDPRFWEMPDRERKVKIDKRFQSMFHDQRFKVKYTVDKRGRPINTSSTEDLKRFYQVSDSEEEEGEEPKEREKRGKGKEVKKADSKTKAKKLQPSVKVTEEGDGDDEEEQQGSEEEDDLDLGPDVTDEENSEDDESQSESGVESSDEGSHGDSESDSGSQDHSGSDSDSGPDLARGKGNVETSSDEDDDVDVDAILKKEEEEIQHDWGELCKDAPRAEEVSARLAVCNMDWDRMKAKDLLALCNSFVPKGGAVLSVKVYPSEFGKERLKMEETQGPMELKALPEDEEKDTEEDRVYREKLRDYQFKRLKYYYAEVTCDSVDTATQIYSECDGYEYESSCSVLDLRFIPDDVTFDEEPKDIATDVNLSAYTPKLFTSSATTSSKVELTWDETDHDRVTALSRDFNKKELLDMDFKAYLASSSEEEGEGEGGFTFPDDWDTLTPDKATEKPLVVVEVKGDEKKKRKKQSDEQMDKYRSLLKGITDKEKKLQEDKAMEMEITWVPGLKERTEQLVQKKLLGRDTLTPWEEYMEKRKDKKKDKKAHKKQGDSEEEMSEDELPPDVDFNDPFFADELSANTDVKKNQKGKKKKKKQEVERTPEEEEELERQKAEMALLMEDEGDEAKHKHFNFDKIVEQQNLSKKKRKKLVKKGETPEDKDEFQVDVADPRFQAMFTSHLFNLDPSHPSYKQTAATQSLLGEKQRRRQQAEQTRTEHAQNKIDDITSNETKMATASTATVSTDNKTAMDPGLSMLVKSIKSKTQQFQARKKQKIV